MVQNSNTTTVMKQQQKILFWFRVTTTGGTELKEPMLKGIFLISDRWGRASALWVGHPKAGGPIL